MNNNYHKIRQKILKLRKELSMYNYQYYVLNQSKISDEEFDQKLKKLSFLERDYPELFDIKSPTLTVGNKLTSYISTFHHKYRMYSLKNTYSKKEFLIWIQRIKKIISDSFSLVCELKYDGVSINLIYQNGFLSHALTRGDGKQGENVIENVRTIKSIPFKLKGANYPKYIEIRGEIFFSKKMFSEINAKRIKQGLRPYSNQRNTASGTLQIKDTQVVADRNLSFIPYYVIGHKLPFNTQYQSFKYLKLWGFHVPKLICCCNTIEEILHFIDYWNNKNHILPYYTDGIVIKINEYKNQYIIGYTNKYPKWAIAYKFQPNKLSETNLLNITFQVGRTGIITPIANVYPVKISGTIIKKVGLYNDRFIQNMQIHNGDSFFLEKGGGIIPILKKINIKKRLIKTNPICFPKKCPSCQSVLIKKKDLYYCPNSLTCPSQKQRKIQHFVSEHGMNIKGIGKSMIQKLYKKGLLCEITDLYNLNEKKIIKINGVNNISAHKIIKNINKSIYYSSFKRVLYSLGIPHVGEYVSEKLTEHFSHINSIINADYNHLISIPGIGNKIANSILNYFSIHKNQFLVQIIMEKGLSVSSKHFQKTYLPLNGKSFLFTGKLSKMTRNQAKHVVEHLGGKVFNTINNKVNFLVIGKNFGSKVAKCINKQNIEIINEDYFEKLIEKKKKEQ
ncbi:NAD-dependent DNA ligase LigA [Blattabacterium cuenoti]|uniref:NAD-dependent DNA ligase LigA n=1 Tax=Blattabacterium cuenoti TaxID=1653831 RepID=UPI00163D31A1|nr:NAD-dependent DNA ligase LigA [Blattabacterium cuenoti]